jgi:hypothetical protein
MKPIKATLLTIAIFLNFSGNALACKFIPSKDSLTIRLNQQQIVFIGTVQNINNKKVIFNVEHPIKGIQEKTYSFISGGSSCDHRFNVGQQWLMTNNTSLMGPNILIKNSPINNKQHENVQLIRLNDSNIKLNEKWQKCDTTLDCKTLFYGCTNTSVNQNFLKESQSKSWALEGDPRALSCFSPKDPPINLPLCVQNKCGSWDFKFQ